MTLKGTVKKKKLHTASSLLLLLLHKPPQHPSPLPENATYSMKGSKATKQVLSQLLLLSPRFKAHPRLEKKTVEYRFGSIDTQRAHMLQCI